MTGFELSPGITPLLVSAFAVELPLVVGVAYLWWRGLGVELALSLNGIALGLIKVYTDQSDPFDPLLGATVVAAGLAAIMLSLDRVNVERRWVRVGLLVLGLYAIPFGIIKVLSDFYDPFDTFLADAAIVLGGYVVLTSLSRGPPLRRPDWMRVVLVGAAIGALVVLLYIMWKGVGWPVLLELTLIPIVALAYLLTRNPRRGDTGDPLPQNPSR